MAVGENTKIVLRQKRYVFFAFGVALVFYFLNAVLRNLKPFFSAFTQGVSGLKFDFLLVALYHETITIHAFILLIIISLLFGLLVALLVYKARHIGMVHGFLATMGAVFGLAGPSCAACGVGLLSLVGVTSLGFLPFNGAELAYFSIGILLGTLYYVDRNLLTCGIKKKK